MGYLKTEAGCLTYYFYWYERRYWRWLLFPARLLEQYRRFHGSKNYEMRQRAFSTALFVSRKQISWEVKHKPFFGKWRPGIPED